MASLSFEAVESHYGLIGVTPSDVPLGRVVEVAVEGLGGLLLRFLKRDAGEFGTHVVERDRGHRQGVDADAGEHDGQIRIGGGALGFFLWVVALRYASPTRVANTITVNPMIGMAAGTLWLGEPLTAALIAGLVAVCLGVWLATTEWRNTPPS